MNIALRVSFCRKPRAPFRLDLTVWALRGRPNNAIDLGTEAHAVPHSDNGKITSVKIVKGIVYTTTKVKDSKTYTIANRNDTDRIVLLEHANRTDFKLTSKDTPWETAADVHRFKVTAPAGKTSTYTVSEEKDFGSQVVITNNDDQGTLQLVKKVINDNGGTKTVTDFGLSSSAGALVFDGGVTVGSTTTYTTGMPSRWAQMSATARPASPLPSPARAR